MRISFDKDDGPKYGLFIGTTQWGDLQIGFGIGFSYYEDGVFDIGVVIGRSYYKVELARKEVYEDY